MRVQSDGGPHGRDRGAKAEFRLNYHGREGLLIFRKVDRSKRTHRSYPAKEMPLL